MKHLIELVGKVISSEYYAASIEHGQFNNSDHESYAIIREEFEESQNEVHLTAESLSQFWSCVKLDADDSAKLQSLKCLEHRATLAACELIQVAAMARKAMLTIHERRQD